MGVVSGTGIHPQRGVGRRLDVDGAHRAEVDALDLYVRLGAALDAQRKTPVTMGMSPMFNR